MVPGAAKRYQQHFEQGRQNFDAAVVGYNTAESDRVSRLHAALPAYEGALAKAKEYLARQHAEIERFKQDFHAGVPAALTQYLADVLELSQYPEDFPQTFRLAYVPESHQLVVKYYLPPHHRIPTIGEHKYIRAGDKITEKSRPAHERQEMYKALVAKVTVRTLHEIFEADRAAVVDTVAFNGHVDTINAATGRAEEPA